MIALRADSEAELLQLVAAADAAGLVTHVVQDAGRTQVPPRPLRPPRPPPHLHARVHCRSARAELQNQDPLPPPLPLRPLPSAAHALYFAPV